MFAMRQPARHPMAMPSPVAVSGLAVEIYPRAARRQHGIIRPDSPHLAGGAIQHIGAMAAVALLLGDPRRRSLGQVMRSTAT